MATHAILGKSGGDTSLKGTWQQGMGMGMGMENDADGRCRGSHLGSDGLMESADDWSKELGRN